MTTIGLSSLLIWCLLFIMIVAASLASSPDEVMLLANHRINLFEFVSCFHDQHLIEIWLISMTQERVAGH